MKYFFTNQLQMLFTEVFLDHFTHVICVVMFGSFSLHVTKEELKSGRIKSNYNYSQLSQPGLLLGTSFDFVSVGRIKCGSREREESKKHNWTYFYMRLFILHLPLSFSIKYSFTVFKKLSFFTLFSHCFVQRFL